jgi:hypothetical protein
MHILIHNVSQISSGINSHARTDSFLIYISCVRLAPKPVLGYLMSAACFLLSCHSKLKLASIYVLPFCPSKKPYSLNQVSIVWVHVLVHCPGLHQSCRNSMHVTMFARLQDSEVQYRLDHVR